MKQYRDEEKRRELEKNKNRNDEKFESKQPTTQSDAAFSSYKPPDGSGDSDGIVDDYGF